MILSVKVWKNSHWTQLWTNDLGKFQNHTIWEGTHNLEGHLSPSISSNEKLGWSHPGWSLHFRRGWWEAQEAPSAKTAHLHADLSSTNWWHSWQRLGFFFFFSFIFSFHLLSFATSLSTSDSTAVSRNNSRQRQVFTHVLSHTCLLQWKAGDACFLLGASLLSCGWKLTQMSFFFSFLFYSFSQSEFVGEAREYSVLWREWVCSKLVDVSLQFDSHMSSIDGPKWYC